VRHFSHEFLEREVMRGENLGDAAGLVGKV